jgi:hypothetical protein
LILDTGARASRVLRLGPTIAIAAGMRSAFLALPLLAAVACMDSTPTPSGTTSCDPPTYYRIDRVQLPTTFNDPVGFDLDHDGTIDNALGNLNATLLRYDPDFPDMNKVASERLIGVPWIVSRTACDDGSIHVELGDSGGGESVPLTVLVDPLAGAQLAWVRPIDVQNKLTVTGDELDGTIGFALPMPDAQRALLAPIATYLTDELATGSTSLGKTIDTDHDGVVTVDEMLANDLVKTLVFPDLDHALSAGMTIHATRVDL